MNIDGGVLIAASCLSGEHRFVQFHAESGNKRDPRGKHQGNL